MKQITASIYEEQALDYLEGRLSEADRAAFERYLDTHTDAAADIEALRQFMPVAAAEPVLYLGMETLLRGPKINPLRRIASLMAGAAASALLVCLLMLIGRNDRVADATPAAPEAPAVELPVVEAPAVPETPPVQMAEATPADPPVATPRPAARIAAHAGAAADAGVQPARVTASPDPAPAPEPIVLAAAAPAAQPEPSPFATANLEPIFPISADDLRPILADFTPAVYEHHELEEPEFYEPSESEFHKSSNGSLLGRGALIRPYEDEVGRGVEIASLIRIGRKNQPNKAEN